VFTRALAKEKTDQDGRTDRDFPVSPWFDNYRALEGVNESVPDSRLAFQLLAPDQWPGSARTRTCGCS